MSEIIRDPTSGHLYVAGYFTGTLTLGSTTLTSTGQDGFVAKLSPSGQWQWAVNVSGSANEFCNGLGLDANGNVYVAGGYSSPSVTIGLNTLTNTGGTDMYVAKLNASGQWQWATKAGGIVNDSPGALAVDSNGNAYLTGHFMSGGLLFGSIAILNSGLAHQTDLFVAKINTSGQWQWAVAAGGTDEDQAHSIAVDGSGAVYVGGSVRTNTATFGSITINNGNTHPFRVSRDAYLAKLDAAGQWQWVQFVAKAPFLDDYVTDMAIGTDGNVYLTGLLNEAIGPFAQPNGYQLGVGKISPSGQWQWAASARGGDFGGKIALDNSNNVYVSGYFHNATAVFGSATLINTVAGGTGSPPDIYTAKLRSDGSNWEWAIGTGGTDADYGGDLLVTPTGHVFTTGYFAGIIYFGSTRLNVDRPYNAGYVARLASPTLSTGSAARTVALVNAFPNPAAQTVQLHVASGVAGKLEVTVQDATGRVVLSRQWTGLAGHNVTLLESATWPAGLYVLTAVHGGMRQTLKLVHH